MNLLGNDYTLAHAITVIGTYAITVMALFRLVAYKDAKDGGDKEYKYIDTVELNARMINNERANKDIKDVVEKNRTEQLKFIDDLRDQHRIDVKDIYTEIREVYETVITKLSNIITK